MASIDVRSLSGRRITNRVPILGLAIRALLGYLVSQPISDETPDRAVPVSPRKVVPRTAGEVALGTLNAC